MMKQKALLYTNSNMLSAVKFISIPEFINPSDIKRYTLYQNCSLLHLQTSQKYILQYISNTIYDTPLISPKSTKALLKYYKTIPISKIIQFSNNDTITNILTNEGKVYIIPNESVKDEYILNKELDKIKIISISLSNKNCIYLDCNHKVYVKGEFGRLNKIKVNDYYKLSLNNKFLYIQKISCCEFYFAFLDFSGVLGFIGEINAKETVKNIQKIQNINVDNKNKEDYFSKINQIPFDYKNERIDDFICLQKFLCILDKNGNVYFYNESQGIYKITLKEKICKIKLIRQCILLINESYNKIHIISNISSANSYNNFEENIYTVNPNISLTNIIDGSDNNPKELIFIIESNSHYMEKLKEGKIKLFYNDYSNYNSNNTSSNNISNNNNSIKKKYISLSQSNFNQSHCVYPANIYTSKCFDKKSLTKSNSSLFFGNNKIVNNRVSQITNYLNMLFDLKISDMEKNRAYSGKRKLSIEKIKESEYLVEYVSTNANRKSVLLNSLNISNKIKEKLNTYNNGNESNYEDNNNDDHYDKKLNIINEEYENTSIISTKKLNKNLSLNDVNKSIEIKNFISVNEKNKNNDIKKINNTNNNNINNINNINNTNSISVKSSRNSCSKNGINFYKCNINQINNNKHICTNRSSGDLINKRNIKKNGSKYQTTYSLYLNMKKIAKDKESKRVELRNKKIDLELINIIYKTNQFTNKYKSNIKKKEDEYNNEITNSSNRINLFKKKFKKICKNNLQNSKQSSTNTKSILLDKSLKDLSIINNMNINTSINNTNKNSKNKILSYEYKNNTFFKFVIPSTTSEIDDKEKSSFCSNNNNNNNNNNDYLRKYKELQKTKNLQYYQNLKKNNILKNNMSYSNNKNELINSSFQYNLNTHQISNNNKYSQNIKSKLINQSYSNFSLIKNLNQIKEKKFQSTYTLNKNTKSFSTTNNYSNLDFGNLSTLDINSKNNPNNTNNVLSSKRSLDLNKKTSSAFKSISNIDKKIKQMNSYYNSRNTKKFIIDKKKQKQKNYINNICCINYEFPKDKKLFKCQSTKNINKNYLLNSADKIKERFINYLKNVYTNNDGKNIGSDSNYKGEEEDRLINDFMRYELEHKKGDNKEDCSTKRNNKFNYMNDNFKSNLNEATNSMQKMISLDEFNDEHENASNYQPIELDKSTINNGN